MRLDGRTLENTPLLPVVCTLKSLTKVSPYHLGVDFEEDSDCQILMQNEGHLNRKVQYTNRDFLYKGEGRVHEKLSKSARELWISVVSITSTLLAHCSSTGRRSTCSKIDHIVIKRGVNAGMESLIDGRILFITYCVRNTSQSW